MAKKKTKEVKEVVPFQIQNEKPETKWFIQSGWKFYWKMCPLPYSYKIPSLKHLK